MQEPAGHVPRHGGVARDAGICVFSFFSHGFGVSDDTPVFEKKIRAVILLSRSRFQFLFFEVIFLEALKFFLQDGIYPLQQSDESMRRSLLKAQILF